MKRKPPVRRVPGDQGGWVGTPAALRTKTPISPCVLVRGAGAAGVEECHLCGRDVFFISYGGRLVCASCHPPVNPAELVQGRASRTPITQIESRSPVSEESSQDRTGLGTEE